MRLPKPPLKKSPSNRANGAWATCLRPILRRTELTRPALTPKVRSNRMAHWHFSISILMPEATAGIVPLHFLRVAASSGASGPHS